MEPFPFQPARIDPHLWTDRHRHADIIIHIVKHGQFNRINFKRFQYFSLFKIGLGCVGGLQTDGPSLNWKRKVLCRSMALRIVKARWVSASRLPLRTSITTWPWTDGHRKTDRQTELLDNAQLLQSFAYLVDYTITYSFHLLTNDKIIKRKIMHNVTVSVFGGPHDTQQTVLLDCYYCNY